MSANWKFIFFLALAFFIASCQTEVSEIRQDPVLAKVYNKTLVLSDIEGIVSFEPDSPKDSLHRLQSFVDRWVAEAILIHEAEKQVIQNIDVDKLVRDYRSSLILSHYEQTLFEQELNLEITDKDLHDYFSSHKKQFRLSYDIVRYIYAQATLEKIDKPVFEQWWNVAKESISKDARQYFRTNTTDHHLNREKWLGLQDLIKKIPPNLRKGLSDSTDVMLENNNYLYALKIFKIGRKGDTPPISFVRDQIEKIILHSRKMKLLEDKKKALYQKEINGSNVEIFTN